MRSLKRAGLWLTKASVIAAGFIWTGTAQAQCLASVGALQRDIETATAKLKQVTDQTAKAQSLVDKRAKGVDAVVASQTFEHLQKAQRAYDDAAADLQALLIPRVEAERTLRGVQQMMREAAISYRAQGEALANATERARRGEITPSLSDALSCEGGDCGRIDARTHAAMITIGAVAETVESTTWPTPGRECDFILFAPSFAQTQTALKLTVTQRDARRQAQAANSALRMARQQHDIALQERAAIIAQQDPAQDKLQDLTKSVRAAAENLQRAQTAADAAQQQERAATETLDRHLDYWGHVATATIAASYTDNSLRLANSDLETAAFVVMGANPTGKAKACLLQARPGQGRAGQEKAMAFAPVPPAKC